MKNGKSATSIRDLFSLSFIIIMPTIMQTAPGRMVGAAGPAVWVAGLLTFIPIFLFFLFLQQFLKNRAEGEGIQEMFMRALGPVAGRAVLLLHVLWMVFFAAYTLYTGATRLSSSIYPHSAPSFFIYITLATCTIAALGRVSTLTRTAARVLPLLAAVTIFVIVLALFKIDWRSLLPVSYLDAPKVLRAVGSGYTMTCTLGMTLFFVGNVPLGDQKKKAGRACLLCAGACLTLTLICVSSQGIFGQAISSKLTMPFFTLVRSLTVFESLERFEALIISIWVLGDFFLVSTLLIIATKNLQLVFGCQVPDVRGKRLPMFRQGRWTVWLCAALTLLCALVIDSLPQLQYNGIRNTVLPYCQYFLTLILLPVIFIVGKLRRTI